MATFALAAAAVLWGWLWLGDPSAYHFGVVQEGVLYRSGQPDEASLKKIIDRYGIKTVVNLRGACPDEPWWPVEDRVCRDRNVRLVNAPIMHLHDPVHSLQEFLATVSDKANQPVLVHCECGTQRTGFAVAAFRIAVQGWDYQRAADEARQHKFHFESDRGPEYASLLQRLSGGADWRELGRSATAPRPEGSSSRESSDR